MINLSHFQYGYQAIDRNHLHFIQGLIVSAKPKKCLELGIGTGNVSQTINDALNYNEVGDLVSVDNWCDWKGEEPPIANKLRSLGIKVVTQEESDFIAENESQNFDFILSDGAHGSSHKNAEKLFGMLNPNGVLVAHDVTNPNFKNLYHYVDVAEKIGASTFLFQESTKSDERCHRGMLVARI